MIILDTETTDLLKPEGADLSTQPHIIEIAMVQLHHSSYKIVDEYQALLDPGVPLDEETHKKITGLTNADLAGKPNFLELVDEIAEFCRGQEVLIAHNLAFDRGVLVAELKRIGREFSFPYPPKQICTVDSTRHLRGHRLKLTELYELKIGKKLKQTHRAMDDVLALAAIVKEMKL
jgi:DNA polymerase III subunit epsilon